MGRKSAVEGKIRQLGYGDTKITTTSKSRSHVTNHLLASALITSIHCQQIHLAPLIQSGWLVLDGEVGARDIFILVSNHVLFLLDLLTQIKK